METVKDLVHCGDGFHNELFIQDGGHLGIYFIFLAANGQYHKMRVAPFELAPLIRKLTEFKDRNTKEGVPSKP